ncbi:MAG: hypothetical protein AAGO57_07900, partial [Pseudomonadota bacterium]
MPELQGQAPVGDETKPQPKLETARSAEPARARGGFYSTVFGGLVAGAIGFAIAWFLLQSQNDGELPARLSGVESAIEAIETRVSGFEGQ